MNRKWLIGLLLCMPVISCAQSATTEPSAGADSTQLGELFESRVAGLAFQPPVGGTLVRQVGSGDIVRFVYPDKGWDLHAKLVKLGQPVPLSAEPGEGKPGGLLEMTADELKATNPKAQILFQGVKPIVYGRVGLVMARYDAGVNRQMTREAIFRADDKTYYIVQFTSPGKPAADMSLDEDDQEKLATAAFTNCLTTVKLLDRSDLKNEQMGRLFHTRMLYATWDDKKIQSVLQPESYTRIVKDGKDVGWVQQKEVTTNQAGNDGVEITVKSHYVADPSPTAGPTPTTPTGPTVTERVSRMFVTFDRLHEEWSSITKVDDGSGVPIENSELGNSDVESRRALDKVAADKMEKGDANDKNQPKVRETDRHTLSVANYQRNHASPGVQRGLPPYYLPMALGNLLPRLLPADGVQSYMFATYVSDQKEVMMRYVDVARETDATLDGKTIRAVPITDHIGADSPPLIHYVTRDGEWLGTVNRSQKLEILPATRDAIQQIWPTAKLNDNSAAKSDNVR